MKTRLFLQILVLVIIGLLASAFLFRFVGLSASQQLAVAYKIDRLTGNIWLVSPRGIEKLSHLPPEPPRQQPGP